MELVLIAYLVLCAVYYKLFLENDTSYPTNQIYGLYKFTSPVQQYNW